MSYVVFVDSWPVMTGDYVTCLNASLSFMRKHRRSVVVLNERMARLV